MNSIGPFFSVAEAAKYCGYHPRSFAKLAKEYRIPRRGPNKTKFSRADLDTFMTEPGSFLAQGKRYTRPAGGFTPLTL